jgi:hypothetical protein
MLFPSRVPYSILHNLSTRGLTGDQTKTGGGKALAWLKWFWELFKMGFFAVLPAGFILVLYVIPTSHERLWTILGETVFLVCLIIGSE